MTVLEAIVAVVIAFGVVVGALEASQMAATRAGLAELDAEVAVRAERLVASVGSERPLAVQHADGSDDGGITWALDVTSYADGVKGPLAFDIVAQVAIRHGGLTARQQVASLKWRPEPPR